MAEPEKRTSLADALGEPETVLINSKLVEVYPLTITDVVGFSMAYRESFFSLYNMIDISKSAEVVADDLDLNMQIIANPQMFADLLATSMREPEKVKEIQARIPSSVQLIALHKIWTISVPDPKKQQGLLLGVMDKLLKLQEKRKADLAEAQKIALATTSPQPSNNS